MKKTKRKDRFLLAYAVCTLLPACAAIFDDVYVTKLPEVRHFNCRWSGGSSSSTLECICDKEAKEMIFDKDSISSIDIAAIDVVNCPNVTFKENSIYHMRNMRRVALHNVPSITFEEKSLNWYGYKDVNVNQFERFDLGMPSVKIIVTNSTVAKISSHAFSGRINEISFEDVTVEEIEPFAFSNLLQNEKITLRNVELRNVKLQSFKRFCTEFLDLENVRATLLPSRTFANITVYESFTISNCTFGIVRPGAFTVYNPKNFDVRNTKITQLDGEAFAVTTRGDVMFKNNIFLNVNDGAFLGLKLNKQEVFGHKSVTFDSNTFSRLTRQSLTVDDFTPKFFNLNLNATCDCGNIEHNLDNSDFYAEIRCLYEGDYITVREFKYNECSLVGSNYTVTIIVCVVVLLLGLISIVLYIYYVKVYRSKKYGSEKQGKVNNLSLIVPDGRTYRETELHVIVERADLLTTDL